MVIKKKIEEISKQKVLGSPKFQWFKDDIGYFEYPHLKIAFDIVIGVSRVGIDIVLRKGADKEILKKIYSGLEDNYRCRLFTLEKDRACDFILDLINKEYLYISDKLSLLASSLISQDHPLYYVSADSQNLVKLPPLKMYFWTGVPNFGDQVGPWLGSKLTGRPIINVRDLSNSSNAIFGVGSIIGMVREQDQNCRIWGSGLITDRNSDVAIQRLKKANVKKITAVRGKITEKILLNSGLQVDPVYGDPALIFSKLYSPKEIHLNSKRVIVPHYIHYELFSSLNLKDYHIVDVRSGVLNVINEIANADIIISTSLHGLILAQSYDVPWIHLHLYDGMTLSGDDFKFKDYFTTLNADKVKQVKVGIADLGQEVLDRISRSACLPNYDKSFNPGAIIHAFYKAID